MAGDSGSAPQKQTPQLASNIEGFDNSLRLLIAVAARAAANLQLPQDASLPNEDIKSITESLAAYSIDEKPATPAPQLQPAPQEKQTRAGEKAEEQVSEVDEQEVQEAAKAIAAATAAETTPQLSPEELRREREKLKASIDKVEAANAEAAKTRKRQAYEWADEVAKHCKFGRSLLAKSSNVPTVEMTCLLILPQTHKPYLPNLEPQI